MKGVAIEPTTHLRSLSLGKVRVETVLGIGVQHLLVHRVAIVFALYHSLRLSVSPLVGRLERKAALVFISRCPVSLQRP